MAVSKVGQRRQVVIPKDICEGLGLQEGDFVEVTEKKGSIIIKPKKLVDPADTLNAEEEKVVARGFEQLKRGDYATWEKVKHDLDL